VRILAKRYHFGVNWPSTLCENKDEVHFFTLKFECIIGVTSYYCVMLQVVILYDAIKTIQNVVFVFFYKKQNLFRLKKNQKRIKKTKKKKPGFSQP